MEEVLGKLVPDPDVLAHWLPIFGKELEARVTSESEICWKFLQESSDRIRAPLDRHRQKLVEICPKYCEAESERIIGPLHENVKKSFHEYSEALGARAGVGANAARRELARVRAENQRRLEMTSNFQVDGCDLDDRLLLDKMKIAVAAASLEGSDAWIRNFQAINDDLLPLMTPPDSRDPFEYLESCLPHLAPNTRAAVLKAADSWIIQRTETSDEVKKIVQAQERLAMRRQTFKKK